MFNITKPSLTPKRVLAMIAAGGICTVLAACSSSGSSSAPAAPSSVASSAASVASSAASSGVSAADCVVIKQVDSSAISTLTPLATDSTAQATAALQAYVTQLLGDQAKLTSAAGKSALSAYIASLKTASNQSTADATTTITTALGKLAAACP